MKIRHVGFALVGTILACGERTNVAGPPPDTRDATPIPRWEWDWTGIATVSISCPHGIGLCRTPIGSERDSIDAAEYWLDQEQEDCVEAFEYFMTEVFGQNTPIIVANWNHWSSPRGGHFDDHAYPDIVLGDDLITNDGANGIMVTILHEARHHLQGHNNDNCDQACEDATEHWAQACEGAVSPFAQQ